MTSGDTIAIFAIAVPVLMAVLGLVITNLISSNKELRTKVEAKDVIIRNKDDTIAELKRQLDKLEITGTLMHRFFSQLPKANEISKEIQP